MLNEAALYIGKRQLFNRCYYHHWPVSQMSYNELQIWACLRRKYYSVVPKSVYVIFKPFWTQIVVIPDKMERWISKKFYTLKDHIRISASFDHILTQKQ